MTPAELPTWRDFPAIYTDELLRVVDIAAWLPKHRAWPYNYRHTARYRQIRARPVTMDYWHHTAGAVPPGLEGPLATTRYIIADPPKGRGWPAMPYHVFIPYHLEADEAGRLVVYLCQLLDMWAWHTGGTGPEGRRNKVGVGVAFQGRFYSRHRPDLPPLDGQTGYHPSPGQLVASWAVWRWLSGLFPALELSCHAWAGKPECPGDMLEDWCREMA